MFTWCIDSITKIPDSHNTSLVRFIKYKKYTVDTTNPNEESPQNLKSPGARYYKISHQDTTLECGQAYRINIHTHQAEETVIFDGNTFVRDIDTENELAAEFLMQQELASELIPINNPTAESLDDYDTVAPAWSRVYVHNVGQGDTIVVELPDNNIWIIDAWFWKNESYERFKTWYRENINDNLHVNRVIISHFHYDHIRSIPRIINDFDVREVLIPNSLIHKTSTATLVLRTAGSRLRFVNNQTIEIFGNLQASIIPTSSFLTSHSNDPNDHGLAITLTIGSETSLLSGDIPGHILDLMTTGIHAHSMQFYKVSHHGSYSGYNQNFFQHLQPKESIISCAMRNKYSHPSNELIRQFTNKPAITYRDGKQVYCFRIC